jgi:PIN domain nuclease of toxin-antitoxin system
VDTHVFLWAGLDDARLSGRARHLLTHPATELYLSLASYWELCIKASLGKLAVTADWMDRVEAELERNAMRWLPIEPPHCRRVAELPLLHRDPFDRMLVSQAQVEGMKLLSADPGLDGYGVERIW